MLRVQLSMGSGDPDSRLTSYALYTEPSPSAHQPVLTRLCSLPGGWPDEQVKCIDLGGTAVVRDSFAEKE